MTIEVNFWLWWALILTHGAMTGLIAGNALWQWRERRSAQPFDQTRIRTPMVVPVYLKFSELQRLAPQLELKPTGDPYADILAAQRWSALKAGIEGWCQRYESTSPDAIVTADLTMIDGYKGD